MIKPISVTTEKKTEDGVAFTIAAVNGSLKNITLNLEPELWTALHEICLREQSSIRAVCTAVYMTKAPDSTIDRAMRFFIFDYFRSAATEQGHARARHRTTCASLTCATSIH